jgi:hypothetical protein
VQLVKQVRLVKQAQPVKLVHKVTPVLTVTSAVSPLIIPLATTPPYQILVQEP